MKKKIFALILAVSMVFSAGFPAFASEKTNSSADSTMHIMWENTDVASVFLNFDGDCAECAGYVEGKTGTSKITATALLKRVNSNGTTTVKAWTGLSASGANFYFDKSYYVSSGYTYIFEIDAQVYRNGTVEYISESCSGYCG